MLAMLRIQETSKSCHRDLLSTKRVKQGDSSNLDYLASYVYSIKISWLLITQNLLFIFFSSTKDELSRHISSLNVNNTAMKLRKAALKARHQKELNDLRTRMQKEIDQSLNELKMASDIKRMQAVEEQVTWIHEWFNFTALKAFAHQKRKLSEKISNLWSKKRMCRWNTCA